MNYEEKNKRRHNPKGKLMHNNALPEISKKTKKRGEGAL